MSATGPGPDGLPAAPSGLRAAWPTIVSWAVCVALVPATGYGLLTRSAYRGYPQQTVLTSRAQDVLTLCVLPLLVLTAGRSRRGSVRGHVVWLGLLFYLLYSYGLYLVGWPQNRAFLLYVVVVTLCAAALLDGVARIDPVAVQPAVAGLPGRALGWFLVVVGVLFAGLWLSDVGPSAWGGRAPVHLGVGGAPYAVYVMDLTLALPVVVAVGVMLVRRHPMSLLLGGVVLVKVVTLFTALWLGVLVSALAGEHVAFTPDMVPSAVLLVVLVVVLARGLRRLGRPAAGWLRVTLWPAVGDPRPGELRAAGSGARR